MHDVRPVCRLSYDHSRWRRRVGRRRREHVARRGGVVTRGRVSIRIAAGRAGHPGSCAWIGRGGWCARRSWRPAPLDQVWCSSVAGGACRETALCVALCTRARLARALVAGMGCEKRLRRVFLSKKRCSCRSIYRRGVQHLKLPSQTRTFFARARAKDYRDRRVGLRSALPSAHTSL